MSASIVVAIPSALLIVIALTCFVGCGFQTHGIGLTGYLATVTNTPNLVACWPLDDPLGSTTARDISNSHFDGTYTVGPNVPAYNPTLQSDAAPGTFALQQPNIVPGDVFRPGALQRCPQSG